MVIRDDLPEVILVHVAHVDDAPAALEAYLTGKAIPDGATITGATFDDYSARLRVADCDCGLIQCACLNARKHSKECRYRVALTCAVPIACVHGYDACPQCDSCSCGT